MIEVDRVKVGKPLTKEELLKENYELEQKVAKLEIQIETLKDILADRKPYVCPVPYQPPVFQDPYIYPFLPNDTGGTGDPLPAMPNINICLKE